MNEFLIFMTFSYPLRPLDISSVMLYQKFSIESIAVEKATQTQRQK